MFFEVMRADTGRGEIGLATSPDGSSWSYERIVLAEPFHVSYPYVFEWQADVYMIPETGEAKVVRLYRARVFPFEWEFVGELLAGERFVDASVFRLERQWWMLTEVSPVSDDAGTVARHGSLRLYGASNREGPWIEHPMSPVVTNDAKIARPAGRIVRTEQRLVRFAQDCSQVYGLSVRAFEIQELSATTYRERPLGEMPLLGPGRHAWNRGGTHHIDAHFVEGQWVACVDGWSPRLPSRKRSSEPEAGVS